MLDRQLNQTLVTAAGQYPIVTVTGPRQSGKTTLACNSFPNYQYVSLEDPDIREFALNDPRGFLNHYRSQCIFDEIQRVPELFSYLQSNVDKDSSHGRFILTGSHQFLLNRNISQSLAGRTALMRLLPFSLAELQERQAQTYWYSDQLLTPEKPEQSLYDYLFAGMYPRVHTHHLDPRQFYRDYIDTYLSRDLRELTDIGDLAKFMNFLRIVAGRSGQRINLNSISDDTGVSHTTIKRWLSTLEASYIIHIVPPHYNNLNKRITKTPKLYFLDTGLLCYLLQIKSASELPNHPFIGAIFESFVFSELYKSFYHRNEAAPLYFLHTTQGKEIDFIIERGTSLQPIEVKASQTLISRFFENLKKWIEDSDQLIQPALIYGGNEWQLRHYIQVIPWYGIS